MIIDCVSDTHGYYHELELEGGDLLIIAGDLTARDTQKEIDLFDDWLSAQEYTKKIFIAGNHDNRMVGEKPRKYMQKIGAKETEKFEYLCDSGTEYQYLEQIPHPASTEQVSVDLLCCDKKTLKIWGSPWTKTFEGMNPQCKAFTVDTDEELAEKWALIPDDTDILVTHSPPRGVLDRVKEVTKWGLQEIEVGSQSLSNKIRGNTKRKLHVFGHVHESYGKIDNLTPYAFVNASYVNENYEPVNKPVRIIL